jgi:hypothetical protein
MMVGMNKYIGGSNYLTWCIVLGESQALRVVEFVVSRWSQPSGACCKVVMSDE